MLEQKIGIKSWAEADRPREKLIAQGRRHLSDAELLAIVISSGSRTENAVDVSKRILLCYENDLTELAKISIKQLSTFNGVSTAKAVKIIAALELGRRRKELTKKQPFKINSSKDIYEVLLPEFKDLTHEEFWMLILNRSHRVTSKQFISKGGQAGTIVDPKIIFKMALERNAAAIILAHNHPSGNLKPSSADVQITKKMVQAGILLEIPVLDHLIITDGSYTSLADEGLMR